MDSRETLREAAAVVLASADKHEMGLPSDDSIEMLRADLAASESKTKAILGCGPICRGYHASKSSAPAGGLDALRAVAGRIAAESIPRPWGPGAQAHRRHVLRLLDEAIATAAHADQEADRDG